MDVPRIEETLGFDRVRKLISDRCSSFYAVRRVEEETFSTDPKEIARRLALTDEMRLIAMFEDSFPTSGYIDCLEFLVPLENSGTLDVLSLGKLGTMLTTLRRLIHFFGGIRDGVYPNLKRMMAPVNAFPEVTRRIDLILDRHGAVKDTASDELYRIRKEIAEKRPRNLRHRHCRQGG